ncbi:MAG: hypothetical protein ACO3LE_06770, partial [Bdellovibrionota bacterium]
LEDQKEELESLDRDLANRIRELENDVDYAATDLDNELIDGANNSNRMVERSRERSAANSEKEQGETSEGITGVRDEILVIRDDTEEKLAQLSNRVAADPAPTIPMPEMKRPMVSDALPETAALKNKAEVEAAQMDQESQRSNRRSMSDVLNNREAMKENEERANSISPVLKPFGEASNLPGFNSRPSVGDLMPNSPASLQRNSRSRTDENERRGGSIASAANQRQVAPAQLAKRIEESVVDDQKPATPTMSRAMSELLVAGIKQAEELPGASNSAKLSKNFLKYAGASAAGETKTIETVKPTMDTISQTKTEASSEIDRLKKLKDKMKSNKQAEKTESEQQNFADQDREMDLALERIEALEREAAEIDFVNANGQVNENKFSNRLSKVFDLRNLVGQMANEGPSDQLIEALQALKRAAESLMEAMGSLPIDAWPEGSGSISIREYEHIDVAADGGFRDLGIRPEFKTEPIILNSSDSTFSVVVTNAAGEETAISIEGAFERGMDLIPEIDNHLNGTSWSLESYGPGPGPGSGSGLRFLNIGDSNSDIKLRISEPVGHHIFGTNFHSNLWAEVDNFEAPVFDVSRIQRDLNEMALDANVKINELLQL